jgi:hypothetical protein
MNRHLTVRDLSGTRILGDFTPPAGSDPAVDACLTRLALECAESHASSGAVIWSAYEPVTIYREASHAS